MAGFADEFLKILETKEWIVVDAAAENKTASALNDLGSPDIAVFYMTDFEEKTHFFYNKFWKKMVDEKFVKILISEDLNERQNTELAQFFAQHGDAILTRYPEALTQVLKNIDNPVPCFDFFHAASRHYYEAHLEFDKKADTVLLSGALSPAFYPLRERAYDIYKNNQSYIEHRKHPGYDTIQDPVAEAVSYAHQIAKNKIAISGAGMGKTPAPYILAKTFEFPAAGTAVVMDDFVEPMMNRLGFTKNVSYISSTPEHLEQDLQFWLKPENREKLKALSEAGHKLVTERHTLEKRVQEFEKIVSFVFARAQKTKKLDD